MRKESKTIFMPEYSGEVSILEDERDPSIITINGDFETVYLSEGCLEQAREDLSKWENREYTREETIADIKRQLDTPPDPDFSPCDGIRKDHRGWPIDEYGNRKKYYED